MGSPFASLSTHNISLYTIPAAWLCCLAPKVWGVVTYERQTKRAVDKRAPRDFFAQNLGPSEQGLDAATKARILRADAAQANGFENLALFAGAVVAGNAARLDPQLLNGLSLGYVASRVAYNVIYVNNDTAGKVLYRMATFFAGLGMVMALYVKAGIKFNEALG